jgi:hypothetical protein
MLRRLYDWVIRLASSRYAIPAMGVVAFAESSFFPIPPDVMLIPLVLANRTKAFRIALVCTVCSVVGGLLGYAIGFYFFETIGAWLVRTYGLQAGLENFRHPHSLQAGDHRLGRGPLRPLHVRVGVHRDAWRTLLHRVSVAVEIRRANPHLHREAPHSGHMGLLDCARRRLRRLPLLVLEFTCP